MDDGRSTVALVNKKEREIKITYSRDIPEEPHEGFSPCIVHRLSSNCRGAPEGFYSVTEIERILKVRHKQSRER